MKKKAPPPLIRRGLRTLIVSSLVAPYCRNECCPSTLSNIGFKTPRGNKIDYEYKPDEKLVMMTKDGHGLSYLGHVLGTLRIPLTLVDILDPSGVPETGDFLDWGTVISIGSHLSNPVTAWILDGVLAKLDPNRIRFEFGELGAAGGDSIVCRVDEADELRFGEPDVDHAAIVYFRRYHSETHVDFLVLAGLGPQGTLAACYRLASEYKNLQNKYAGRSFFQVLESSRGQLMPVIKPVAHGNIVTDIPNGKPMQANGATGQKKFSIAISYLGEHVEYVSKIAEILAKELTKDKVFFDRFYEEESLRFDLEKYLQDIYHKHSEVVVVVACRKYGETNWTQAEYRAIRGLNYDGRADNIVLLRLEPGDMLNIYPFDGGHLAIGKPPDYIAKLILKRLNRLRTKSQ